jgi:hypothetical protein
MALHPVTRGWSLRFMVTLSSHIHRFIWICFIFIVILSTQLEVLFAMCKSGWCVLKYQWLNNPLVDARKNEVFCEWTSAWKPLWLLQLSASKIMKEVPNLANLWSLLMSNLAYYKWSFGTCLFFHKFFWWLLKGSARNFKVGSEGAMKRKLVGEEEEMRRKMCTVVEFWTNLYQLLLSMWCMHEFLVGRISLKWMMKYFGAEGINA